MGKPQFPKHVCVSSRTFPSLPAVSMSSTKSFLPAPEQPHRVQYINWRG